MADIIDPFKAIEDRLAAAGIDPRIASGIGKVTSKVTTAQIKQIQATGKALGDATLYQIGKGKGPEQNPTLAEKIINRIDMSMKGKNNMLMFAAAKAFRGDQDAGMLMQTAEKEASSLRTQFISSMGNMITLTDEKNNPGKYDEQAISQAKAGLRGSFGLYKSDEKLYQKLAGMLPLAQAYQLAFGQYQSLNPVLAASGNESLISIAQTFKDNSVASRQLAEGLAKLVDSGILTTAEAKARLPKAYKPKDDNSNID